MKALNVAHNNIKRQAFYVCTTNVLDFIYLQ